MKDRTTALFIGRFQPFHNGHYNALENALKEYNVIVGIGSAQESHTFDNPLSVEERKTVIQNCFPDVALVGILDRNDDDDWMDWIENNIDFDLGISGNDHVRRIFNGRGRQILHPDYLKLDYYSGTAIREQILAGGEWEDRVPNCSLEKLRDLEFKQRVRSAASE